MSSKNKVITASEWLATSELLATGTVGEKKVCPKHISDILHFHHVNLTKKPSSTNKVST